MYVKVAEMEGTTEATCFILIDLILSGFRARCGLIWSCVVNIPHPTGTYCVLLHAAVVSLASMLFVNAFM